MSKNHVLLDRKRWRIARLRTFERDHYRCAWCGQSGRLEADHIIPLSINRDQDPYHLGGLQALCRSCHATKTASENDVKIDPERERWKTLVRTIFA